jgi:hypothetical protein
MKKRGLGEKPHLKKKSLVRVRQGHGLTRRVAWVWSGFCTSRSFVLPGSVQPTGRLGPRSTRQAGTGLITRAGACNARAIE